MGIFPTLLCARKRLERKNEDVGFQDMNCNLVDSSYKPAEFYQQQRAGQFNSGNRHTSVSGSSTNSEDESFRCGGFSSYGSGNSTQLSTKSENTACRYRNGRWTDHYSTNNFQQQLNSSSSSGFGNGYGANQQLLFRCTTNEEDWVVIDTRNQKQQSAACGGMRRACSCRG